MWEVLKPNQKRRLILYFWRIVGNQLNNQPSRASAKAQLAGLLNAMATREFDDWSPASVFGPRKPTPRHEEAPEVSASAKSSRRRTPPRCEDNNSNHDGERLTQRPLDVEHLSAGTTDSLIKSRRQQVRGEEPALEDEDYAARVIQARLRVWLLYQKEADSIAQVKHLRLELETAAAVAIVDWLRRCLVRFGLVERAGQLRYQHAIRRDAREFVHQWIQQQRNATRFRGLLRRRAQARQKLSCWLRRIQCERRCRRRRELREERDLQAIEKAQRVILRVMWTYIKRRRKKLQAREQAMRLIKAFTVASMLRGRANAETDRRRRRRAASIKINQTLSRWQLRLRFLQWQAATQIQRSAELARQHHAACVLQRLIRVMLTAFRLMRRRDAASKIQSVVRGRQRRRRYRAQLRERRRAAAINIQRCVRGCLARRRVYRMLQQLRERFKCLNCGLIEPGGLYCKFCGRRRTTFDILGPAVAAGLTTTDAKLRKKRKKKPSADTDTTETSGVLPPAAPLPFPRPSQSKRHAHALPISTSIMTMGLPDLPSPSPAKATSSASLPSVLLSPRFTTEQHYSSPVKPPSYPRKPLGAGHNGARPTQFHRSVSAIESALLPVAGLASIDKTRQRAEALMHHDSNRFQQHAQSTMSLHLQRLQKGGKAASR